MCLINNSLCFLKHPRELILINSLRSNVFNNVVEASALLFTKYDFLNSSFQMFTINTQKARISRILFLKVQETGVPLSPNISGFKETVPSNVHAWLQVYLEVCTHT